MAGYDKKKRNPNGNIDLSLPPDQLADRLYGPPPQVSPRQPGAAPQPGMTPPPQPARGAGIAPMQPQPQPVPKNVVPPPPRGEAEGRVQPERVNAYLKYLKNTRSTMGR